jgi:hypothetical protein
MPELKGTHTIKIKDSFHLKKLKTFVIYSFALAGFGIILAWLIFKLGLTKDEGSTIKTIDT